MHVMNTSHYMSDRWQPLIRAITMQWTGAASHTSDMVMFDMVCVTACEVQHLWSQQIKMS